MPPGFRGIPKRRRFVKDDSQYTVEFYKDGRVNILGDFGKVLRVSEEDFETTCQNFLSKGFREY